MCGRFYVDDRMADEIEKIFAKLDGIMEVPKAGDVYPTDKALMVYESDQRGLAVKEASFGYKSSYGNRPLLNARCETVTEKPTFCYDFQSNRCVIPASGYYEWNRKDKYLFQNEESILLMAGIYREGEFVILTTEADERAQEIHDRMPILLNKEEAISWITSKHLAKSLLKMKSTCPNKISMVI